MKSGYWLLIGLAAGLGLGLFIGWVLLPTPPPPSTPDTMRADYQAEYIRLVAVSYQVERDLARAQERLAALDFADPSAPLVAQTELWITRDRPAALITALAQLSHDLGVHTPPMAPYLEQESP